MHGYMKHRIPPIASPRQRVSSTDNENFGLRTFYQREPNKVRMIVRGGEQLAELRYEAGDVSLLNLAGARLWPDLTEADVDWLFDQYETGASLKAGEAAAILRATGGEPRLVARCLRDRADAGPTGGSTTRESWPATTSPRPGSSLSRGTIPTRPKPAGS